MRLPREAEVVVDRRHDTREVVRVVVERDDRFWREAWPPRVELRDELVPVVAGVDEQEIDSVGRVG